MHACGQSCVHMCVRSSWKVPRFPRMASQYGVPGTCEGGGSRVWGWGVRRQGLSSPLTTRGRKGGDRRGPGCRGRKGICCSLPAGKAGVGV